MGTTATMLSQSTHHPANVHLTGVAGATNYDSSYVEHSKQPVVLHTSHRLIRFANSTHNDAVIGRVAFYTHTMN